MGSDFVIFCKSYRGDLKRVLRLVESAARHNDDAIALVLSVPRDDAALFQAALPTATCHLVHDEAIVAAHPECAARDLLARYRATPDYLAQQVVKSEAWRLLGCKAYLCADADTVFLRSFRRSDFLAQGGHPYSLLHQSREYLQLAVDRRRDKVARDFIADSERVRALFGRVGPHYDFGPQPLLWSASVWNDLHERWLAPRGLTLWDAIETAPTEIRWYGEALLTFRSIPLEPIEPLFRVYHYDWQYDLLRRLGETPERVATQYVGAVYQSNWELDFDAAGARSAASRWTRRIKRGLQRWR